MAVTLSPSSKPASLRLAEFAITHFRTFHERTIIPLHTGGRTDALAVFHGDNGAGKSSALAALDLFFRAFSHWLKWRSGGGEGEGVALPLAWDAVQASSGFAVRYRDWPPGVRQPLSLEVRFAQPSLGSYRLLLTPSGSEVLLSAQKAVDPGKLLAQLRDPDYTELAPRECNPLRSLIETPLGPGSRPLFILDDHRRGSWRMDEPPAPESSATLSPLLAERLLALRLSLDPLERERWRSFVTLLSQFPSLKGKELSVDRVQRDAAPELFFEERGRLVLKLEELSSGEQQLVTLCAAIVTSRAALVAIAEPELSLSPSNQRLLKEILEQQVRQGLIDQVLLESHVQVFDGPEVIRFRREEGMTRVTRESRAPDAESLAQHARRAGAEEEYVTADGYTRLPESMRGELGVEKGGMIWFLKDERKRWAAWKTEELDERLGLPGSTPQEG